ncbi:hypothetical protein PVAP13_1NG136319 [Panicum virgatum]|uniref:Uncharacterized protein n=1 Tax=Panicum virgatum TaxID=38727 RepID=A0A8T0WJS4_PANVG|nr:hypothetical protein PVAP13_1NG136319 [Panicum virgatum]
MSSYGPTTAAPADALGVAAGGSYRVCDTVVLICLACASSLIVLTVAVCFRRAAPSPTGTRPPPRPPTAAPGPLPSAAGTAAAWRRPRSRRSPCSRTGGAPAPAPGGRSARSASPWCGTGRRCGGCQRAGTYSTSSASTCGCAPTPRAPLCRRDVGEAAVAAEKV